VRSSRVKACFRASEESFESKPARDDTFTTRPVMMKKAKSENRGIEDSKCNRVGGGDEAMRVSYRGP
jgi:hypothetical protein